MNLPVVVSALLFALAGLGVGVVHFHSLRLTTEAYVVRGKNGRSVALHALRLLLTAAVFVLIARAGAVPLLAAFVGFVVARILVTGRIRGAP